MLSPKHTRRRPIADINVVPYIDVMLVLLIIFMVTAPMLFQGVDVNLPEASSKLIDQKPQEPLILSVDRNNHYYLNIADSPTHILKASEVLTIVTNELKLSKDQFTRQILIKADKELSYEKIIDAMSILQRAGASNIGLLTELNHQSNPKP